MKQNKQFLSGKKMLTLMLSAAIWVSSITGCTLKENTMLRPWMEDLYSHTVQLLNGKRDDRTDQITDENTGVQRMPNGSLQYSDGTQFLVPEDLPEYNGSPYADINGGVPHFTENMFTDVSRETYGEMDQLGRCTTAMACIGTDLMPVLERGSIGMIKPSGWKTVRYDFIDGMYLYNRCHMIGYQLTGENDNERNLITGTRYMNVEGMLPFENQIASYIHTSDCHVLYRVTPVFEGEDLLARGVLLEAESVEDRGESIRFHVFCFNVQPGVVIDYRTGDNYAAS